MRGIGLVLSLLSGLGSVALAAQEQPPLRHEVSVSLKLIQVYVTDKAGKPVMGLGRDDFLLFDNGQRQTITDFERHVSIGEEAALAENLKLRSRSTPEAQMNRKFFIFIDQDANDLIGISKARAAAGHFLDQAMPMDEIGVLSYSTMAGIVLHTHLTTNHAAVREALRRIRDAPGRSENAPPPTDQRISLMTSTDGPVITLTPPAKAGLSSLQMFTDRMRDLAKALRYIPGYKTYSSSPKARSSMRMMVRVFGV